MILNDHTATPNETSVDVVSDIIRYEEGDLDHDEILELFAHLVTTGLAWQLQGSYGRTARDLIDSDYLKPGGTPEQVVWEVDWELVEVYR